VDKAICYLAPDHLSLFVVSIHLNKNLNQDELSFQDNLLTTKVLPSCIWSVLSDMMTLHLRSLSFQAALTTAFD